MKEIQMSNKIVLGQGHPVFIVAEIGYNFNTLDEGLASVDATADCGVDAVKFQTFRAETVVTQNIYFPEEAGGGKQYEEFKRYELSPEWHEALFARAISKGLVPFSTPSHATDLPLLERLNMAVYKVGSDDLTNIPFQTEIAKLGKPMIISTGMSYMSEVAETVEAVRSVNNDQIIVLHTVSNYPIKDLSEVNLQAIKTMSHALDVLVGYSDHTTTFSAPVAAVSLGSCVYERHFTIDKDLPAPDAALSSDPYEMKQIVQLIRETELMLGHGSKCPARTETDMRRDTRKGVVARMAIRKGDILTNENVTIKRPGHGIEPRHLPIVLGRKACVDLSEDDIISWDKI